MINLEDDFDMNAIFVNYSTHYKSNECLINGYEGDFLTVNA